MDSSITPNTTSQNNNSFINSNNPSNPYNTQANKMPTPKEQTQYFSNLLEAFIIFINQLNTTEPTYKLLLALLAYAGKRTAFFAAHKTLYPLIHNYKNPSSVKKANSDSARKYVWRHLTETEAWMDQTGITLFTRIIPEKPKPNEQDKATEYDITILSNILIDIITEAYATRHLFEKHNLGLAIKTAATKKAEELKQSATPKPTTEKNTAKKQLTSKQQLDKIFSLAQSWTLKFKADELAKHTSKADIANTIETKCLSLFNFLCNTITNLREPTDPNLDSSQTDEICPTYQSHIYNYSCSEMSPAPNIEPGIDETFLFKEGILPCEITQQNMDDFGGDVSRMSHNPPAQEPEQVLVDEQVAETFTITLFDSQYEKVGTEADLTLRKFVEHIGINDPVVITPKSDSDDDVLKAKQKNKGFCPVTFAPGTEGRLDNNVENLSMVCFDYDDANFRIDLKPIISLGFRSFLYTSYSHTDINHRFRLGFILKEPIPAKYYNLLWQKLFEVLKREVGKEGTKTILNIDAKCFNTGRMWYLPAIKSKDASYYSEVFDSEDYQLLDWRVFIEQEIKDFDASIENLFQIPTPNNSTTVVEPQTAEEKNKKNVFLSSSQLIKYVDGADKPPISGYRWPSYLRALREKGGDKSLADSSWCYWCAVFGIPEAVAAVGLLQVSEKANYKASRPYGNGRYYHLDTVREAYDFYRGKHKK